KAALTPWRLALDASAVAPRLVSMLRVGRKCAPTIEAVVCRTYQPGERVDSKPNCPRVGLTQPRRVSEPPAAERHSTASASGLSRYDRRTARHARVEQ